MRMSTIVHAHGKTFVGGRKYECQSATVVAFDENGELEWEITTDGCSNVSDMFFRESDSTLVLASRWITSCDFLGLDSGPHIFGLDLEGNYKFDTHITMEEYGSLDLQNLKIATNNSDEIIVVSGEKIFWLDALGNVLSLREHPGEDYLHILSYQNTTLILSSKEQVDIYNELGDIQAELEIPEPIIDVKLDEDNILILTAEKVYNYDFLTAVLNEDSRFANTIIASGFTFDENWLYLWGGDQNDDSHAMIGQLEKSDLNPVQFVSLNQDSVKIIDITSNGTQLFITGDIRNGRYPSSTIDTYESFVKTTAVFASPVYSASVDVSLSNFQVLQRSEVVAYDPTESRYTFDPDHIVFEYDITNEGTDTISSVSVVSQIALTPFCLILRLFVHINSLAIPPNGKIIRKDSLSASLYHFADEIQLTAFAPNHRFDGNPLDNYLVGTDFIVSSNDIDQQRVDFDLKLFPNPANDEINVAFQSSDLSGQKKIRLINLQGQIIEDFNLSSKTSSFKIPLENYSSGIYFLQYLKDGEIMDVEKMIVN